MQSLCDPDEILSRCESIKKKEKKRKRLRIVEGMCAASYQTVEAEVHSHNNLII